MLSRWFKIKYVLIWTISLKLFENCKFIHLKKAHPVLGGPMYLLASFPQQSCFGQSCSSICGKICPPILYSISDPASSYSQEIRQSCLVTLDPQPAVFPSSSENHSAQWAIYVAHLLHPTSPLAHAYHQCGRGLQKPLRPWRWSLLISLAQHIMQQCDLWRAINIQDSLKYLVAWCGNVPLHFLGDIPKSKRTSNTGTEYPNQDNEPKNGVQMTFWSCTGSRLDYREREINPEHRGHMYPFRSRGPIMGLPLKAICEPNELFFLGPTKLHQTTSCTLHQNINTIYFKSS